MLLLDWWISWRAIWDQRELWRCWSEELDKSNWLRMVPFLCMRCKSNTQLLKWLLDQLPLRMILLVMEPPPTSSSSEKWWNKPKDSTRMVSIPESSLTDMNWERMKLSDSWINSDKLPLLINNFCWVLPEPHLTPSFTQKSPIHWLICWLMLLNLLRLQMLQSICTWLKLCIWFTSWELIPDLLRDSFWTTVPDMLTCPPNWTTVIFWPATSLWSTRRPKLTVSSSTPALSREKNCKLLREDSLMRDVRRSSISRSSYVMEPTRDSSLLTRRELILSASICLPKTESWDSEEPREEIWKDLSSLVEEMLLTVWMICLKRILDMLILSMNTNWERKSIPLLKDASTLRPVPCWSRDLMNIPSPKLRKPSEMDWELSRILFLINQSFQEVVPSKLLPTAIWWTSKIPFLERLSSELKLSLRVYLLFQRFWLRTPDMMFRMSFWNWLMSTKRIRFQLESTVWVKKPPNKRSAPQSHSESGIIMLPRNNGYTLPQLLLNNFSLLMRSWELERIWEEVDFLWLKGKKYLKKYFHYLTSKQNKIDLRLMNILLK